MLACSGPGKWALGRGADAYLREARPYPDKKRSQTCCNGNTSMLY